VRLWAAAALILASMLVARSAVLRSRRARVEGLVGVARYTVRGGGFASWFDRLGRWPAVARLGSSDRLLRRARFAGLRWPNERLAAMRLSLLVAALAPALLALAGLPVALPLTAIVIVAALRLPDLLLERIGRRRRARMDKQVPDLVELLLVTGEAGLSPSIAFRRSAEVLGPPLGDELRIAVRAMDLGLPWRAALDQLVDGNGSAALRALGGALTRSQRLGASTGPALRGLADDLRAERRVRTEERARRAPVKMLFPLVFLVLPAFLLLTVGPVLLATIRSLH
jgi:tight adherence protein C